MTTSQGPKDLKSGDLGTNKVVNRIKVNIWSLESINMESNLVISSNCIEDRTIYF